MKQGIDRAFISEHDTFLHRFDKGREKSQSQQKEIKKHQRIFNLRDAKSSAHQHGFIKTMFMRLARVFWH